MKHIRCAIYTRKSSEEGLEQDFNSLDAQREACAAYVLSQASEGWSALPDRYDDGGLSGGTLERPALKRLLADVADGRIDIIVVYKVDRLTRSLLDFSKLVEAFDTSNVSFVSITQSFNTTTSMGRLTLNMLLSFAQFEREVTAERIRDKIAASKARGMWMGGTPPLGYRPEGRTLAVIHEHAALVRHIFERYLAVGTVRLLADELANGAILTPERSRARGGSFGGCPFSRGQIYKLLSNPVYIGEIHHRGQSYKGLHPAIIDRPTWDAVQRRLAEGCQGQRTGARAASPSLLAGLVMDAAGEPLIATHACKGKTRYRYYVSRAVHYGGAEPGWRIPAREIELLVMRMLSKLRADPITLVAKAGLEVPAAALPDIVRRAEALATQVEAGDKAIIGALVDRVIVGDHRVVLRCSTSGLAKQLGLPEQHDTGRVLDIEEAVRLTRTGRAMRLVGGTDLLASRPHAELPRLIARAHRWWAILRAGQTDITGLAAAEGVRPSWITRVVRLAFLSPEIVERALEGRLDAAIGCGTLLATGAIPPGWAAQRQRYL